MVGSASELGTQYRKASIVWVGQTVGPGESAGLGQTRSRGNYGLGGCIGGRTDGFWVIVSVVTQIVSVVTHIVSADTQIVSLVRHVVPICEVPGGASRASNHVFGRRYDDYEKSAHALA